MLWRTWQEKTFDEALRTTGSSREIEQRLWRREEGEFSVAVENQANFQLRTLPAIDGRCIAVRGPVSVRG